MIETLKSYVIPAALALLPAKMSSPEARAMLVAIALQESDSLRYREQIGGPAKGLWQWELPQVGLVLRHEVVGPLALKVLADLSYSVGAPPFEKIHEAMQHNDVLQCAFSRLMLWPDAAPLPQHGDVQGSLATYLRVWKPGRPHPEKWPANWAQAWG